MNAPGRWDCAARTSLGIASFEPPVKRKTTASSPWTIHSHRLVRLLRGDAEEDMSEGIGVGL
jgi:hypothetical protein